MASEWIGAVSTAVTGVAGIVATYMTGRRQADVTVRLAREERVQTRRERAYLEVQRVVERSNRWADQTMPILSASGQDLHPPHPDDNDQVLEASVLRLYWSREVADRVDAWTKARNRLAIHSSMVRAKELNHGEAWRPIPDLKKSLNDAAEALLAQMTKELMEA